MVISSFFPGRLRLRDPVLQDADIASALKAAVESHPAVIRAEYNTQTGSALIEYEPDKLPLQKFELLKDEILALKRLCDFYSENRKETILCCIENLKAKLCE